MGRNEYVDEGKAESSCWLQDVAAQKLRHKRTGPISRPKGAEWIQRASCTIGVLGDHVLQLVVIATDLQRAKRAKRGRVVSR